MEHLQELKEFALLHARGQGMAPAHAARVVSRIANDTPGDARSWASVWVAEGRSASRRGDLLAACRSYALARFPYPADEERRLAQRLCVDAFDTWRGEHDVERLEFPLPGDATCRAWASGLDRDRPLLIVMGGIVSVKEQWAPLLPLLRKIGFAAVVTELPGVGENSCVYAPDSWRMLPTLLDHLAGRARVADTSLLALSFSGHLALRAAGKDARIRRVLTVGAPVTDFFRDTGWRAGVPAITLDTLRRLTGAADRDQLFAVLPEFALTAADLAAIRIPVRYVVSARDEIIPPGERARLRQAPGDIRFKVFDDVHGSPSHLGATRRWLFGSLLRSRFLSLSGGRNHARHDPDGPALAHPVRTRGAGERPAPRGGRAG
ncbi:alpha/beta fold hydrolase [Streptomyces sp. NPDC048172]|uniref:alpha/beta fold hydrolase n=1 Tax=Streptomyces sp. NPDC048172 TaxID=3365505 RepID=UPI00371DFCEF